MAEDQNKISVLIADDHQMMLEGLSSSLSTMPDIEVVDTAVNGREALRKAQKLQPDIVVMDISMPGLNGIEATRKFQQELPNIKIFSISMHSDRYLVADILSAGASGFILKECAVNELAHGIRMIMQGDTYICSKMVKSMVDHFIQTDNEKCGVLSARERELLQLLAEGWNTKEISDKMCIATKTVDTHRRNIMEKLGLNSVAELTKYAIREGITTLD
ncbi:hypothetical protein BVX97_03000 [bacterium E08(2017)]|nr:hypothetical protein BVX97_03000 [bacterium E08(2017)]